MADKKILFLLDAYALIYRAFYAFLKTPRINSKGMNTSAIFGFTNTLVDIVKNQPLTHIGVVFDPAGPTFRHEQFPDYKANRQETPEDLKKSVPYIKRIVEAMNIPILEVAGFEADDVAGTIAKKAAREGFTVYMMTPDKDYCQLVEENVFVYRPRNFGNGIDILGIPEVNEKFEISRPEQVIDILGLWGDASDNVPGAPGIGEKTAKKLIAQYGSIEGIYEHIGELKGKQKENMLNFKSQILQSKYLVTICTNVPIEFEPDKLECHEPNKQAVIELFDELEFKNLASRIFNVPAFKAANPQPMQQLDLFAEPADKPVELELFAQNFNNIENTPHEYILVTTIDERRQLIEKLSTLSEFCFDTETTSLETIEAELVGMSICFEPAKAYYVAFPNDFDETKQIVSEFAEIFANKNIRKIGQNLKYDISVLMNYGIEVAGHLFDTLIAHYILQSEQKHGLDYLSEQYLQYRMVPIDDLIGKKGSQRSFREVPLNDAKEYSGEDADITFQLKEILEKNLVTAGLLDLFEQIEMPLVPILARMEMTGVAINVEALNAYSKDLSILISDLEKQIYELAGGEFNIASPKQLGEILFDKLKIVDKAKKTKTKQYSTAEDVLSKLVGEHEIVQLILDHRSLKKLLSTYIDALPKLIHQKTGRVHTSYNQAVVATGRLSSNNPNLQNIPIRTERGKEVRKAFIPSAGNVFVSADYSQIELRVIAHCSCDPHFIDAFVQGIDIHTATAAKVFGVATNDVTDLQRRQAKSANFAIAYGSSAFGLSETLNIPRAEAKALIDNYYENYPKVKEFMDRQIEFARAKGYVETMFGRRRYIPDINSVNATVRGYAERNAINTPIQGSAADIIKIAMNDIQKEFDSQHLRSRMIMQVHDELNFDVFLDELDVVREIVKSKMESAVKLQVPLIVDLGIGENWLEAH